MYAYFFSERYWLFLEYLIQLQHQLLLLKDLNIHHLHSSSSMNNHSARHFEFFSISADYLRLLPQADHQGNSVFCLQKVFYAKSWIKATDALNQNLNGRFLVTNCLKKARKLFKKEKSCTKSEKLLEGLKVAPNLKSCSKVAEQLMDSPILPPPSEVFFKFFQTIKHQHLTFLLAVRLSLARNQRQVQ